MDEIGPDCSCHHADAPVQISLLYDVVVFDNIPAMEDVAEHIRKGGKRFYMSLQAMLS